MMTEGQDKTPSYKAVYRIFREKPEWIPVVNAALKEAKRTKGEFAGSWVLQTLKEDTGIEWIPNLRLLAGYGILQRTDVTRGGRRAYYLMPDIAGVEKALQEIRSSRY